MGWLCPPALHGRLVASTRAVLPLPTSAPNISLPTFAPLPRGELLVVSAVLIGSENDRLLASVPPAVLIRPCVPLAPQHPSSAL
jgi:hypothetical protein